MYEKRKQRTHNLIMEFGLRMRNGYSTFTLFKFRVTWYNSRCL